MAASKRIAGTAYLKVDGQQYDLRGNLEVGPATIVRAGIAGQDGVHGYSENPVVPYIAGDVSLGNLDTDDLLNITDSTITAELADGSVYTLKDAWWAGPMAISSTNGQVPVRFEGMDAIKTA